MSNRCLKEIVELHEFFVSWMGRGDGDFSRFSGVMAQDFEIISPQGTRVKLEALLAQIQKLKGALAESGFTIWIENPEERHSAPGQFIATYEEWQTRAGETSGRLSTAVFRENPETPNGVEWVHVHETWLPQSGEKAAAPEA